MFIIVNDSGEWLCFDSMSDTYYFKEPWDYRAIQMTHLTGEVFSLIQSQVHEKVRPMRLVLCDVEYDLRQREFI